MKWAGFSWGVSGRIHDDHPIPRPFYASQIDLPLQTQNSDYIHAFLIFLLAPPLSSFFTRNY